MTYTYDLHDRLVTVRDWANRVTRYTWDAAHRLRRLERPNGTTRGLTYDQAGQLLQVEERDAEGVLLAAVRLAYDADGLLTQRLVLPVPPVLAVPSATMTVDADNRVTTVNAVTVTHDADGQLTAGPLPNGVPASYTFDVRHRLQSVGGVSYSYDAEGSRTALTTSAGTLRYTVDPHGGDLPRVLVREELNGTSTLAVYGLGLLYEVTASGAVRYYHYDEIGSTIALTEASGLVVTDRMGYGPFGTLVVRKGTTNTPYLYGGLFGVETDPNGLLYMRARYYHPLLRRFLSPDPIGFAGGLNWYAYAGNNPYQFGDPTGLSLQKLVPGGGSLLPHRQAEELTGQQLIEQVAGPRGGGLDDVSAPAPAGASAGVLVADCITGPTDRGPLPSTSGCVGGGGGGGGGGGRTTLPGTQGPSAPTLLSGARQVSGRFPPTANPNEVLVRRNPQTGAPTHYQVYGGDGLPMKRVDLTGKAHSGVPTPHVLEFERHVNPHTGQMFLRPSDTVRPAEMWEIP